MGAANARKMVWNPDQKTHIQLNTCFELYPMKTRF